MFNRIISITLILILAVIAFTGCDRSADSSYKEVIKDGQVEIDGFLMTFNQSPRLHTNTMIMGISWKRSLQVMVRKHGLSI